jgi:photosystem II stability/assembly factor-like uncharacterized protein
MVDLVMSPAFAEDQTLLALTGTWQTGYTVRRTQDAGQNWQALGSYPGGLAWSCRLILPRTRPSTC